MTHKLFHLLLFTHYLSCHFLLLQPNSTLEVSSSLEGNRVSSRIRGQQQNTATGHNNNNNNNDSDSDIKESDSDSDVKDSDSDSDVDVVEEEQPKSPPRSPLHRRSRRQRKNAS